MRRCHPRGAKFAIRTFECPECRTRMYASKRKGSTARGHVKDLWCYKCQEERKFIQID